MLLTIAAILILLWLIGVALKIGGTLIYVLLLLAAISAIADKVQRSKR